MVHAVLHLLGFDHKKKSKERPMREKEKEVLDYLAKAARLGTMSLGEQKSEHNRSKS